MFYYAVRNGRNVGVFTTWKECEESVKGYSGSIFKKFTDSESAWNFVNNVPEKPSHNTDVPTFTEIGSDCYCFVDGSFNADTGFYGYGGVLFDGTKYHLIQGSGNDADMASMRNVAGEVMGTMEALKCASGIGIKDITIYYDYQGIRAWADKSWKAKREGTVAYVQFIRGLNMNLNFQKVEAHTGVIGNEYADVIAKKAAAINLTRAQRLLYFDALKLCGLTVTEEEE